MLVEGNAVVFCQDSFDSTYGKTAHGLVRFTQRYTVMSVIDRLQPPGIDAAEFLDGTPRGIPILPDLDSALEDGRKRGKPLTHFVIGLATDGGYLTDEIRQAVLEALRRGLNVDSGLHDALLDDGEIRELASAKKRLVRDIRKPAEGSNHMFTGKIGEVESCRIALMGTDSALGKRTTSWMLVHALRASGRSAELIGTGQTSWLQGAQYSIVMDSLVNDYVSGELEHAVWTAWNNERMDFAVIEGQGSLMNPGYPGGFEILAACRPHGVIMQHAPARREYDGFPGFPLDPLEDQIFLVEFLSKRKVIGITINHEGLNPSEIDGICSDMETRFSLPVCDPLVHGMGKMVKAVERLRV